MSKSSPFDAIYVFHDSENCFIPRRKELRDPNTGRLITQNQFVQFGEESAVQGVTVVKKVLENALACVIGKESAAKVDLLFGQMLTYYFVRNNDTNSDFSPNNGTRADFRSISGFHELIASGRKDGVDIKIKELIASEICKISPDNRHKVLFVLVSGDQDFAAEINAVRKAKIKMVVIHSADNPCRDAVKEILEDGHAPCCWLDIIAEARKNKNPYYHPLAPDPSSRKTTPPRLPPSGSGVSSPIPPQSPSVNSTSGKVEKKEECICGQVNVANMNAASFYKMFSMQSVTAAVREIHPNFDFTKLPLHKIEPNGSYVCCELKYLANSPDSIPCTEEQKSSAMRLLQQELNKIIVDEPITLAGTTVTQLKDDVKLTSFMQRERVHVQLYSAVLETSALDMVVTAEALHEHILSLPDRRMAGVDMGKFYEKCTPLQKTIIQKAKAVNFCDVHSFLLNYKVNPLQNDKFGKGCISAMPKPSGVMELFKYILEQGVIRDVNDPRKSITAKQMGDFYGPKGAFPALKAVITDNSNRKLKDFLMLYPLFFEFVYADKDDGFGIIYAQYHVTPAASVSSSSSSSPSAAPSDSVTPANTSPMFVTKAVLTHASDNDLGRNSVKQMLLTACSVIDTIVVQQALLSMMPMLQTLSYQVKWTEHEANDSCTITLSGTPKCVADTKAAVQRCLKAVQTTAISLPSKHENRYGLYQALKKTMQKLLNSNDDEDKDDSSKPKPSNASSSRNMFGSLKRGKPHEAALLFLPPIEEDNDLVETYKNACATLQEVANSYAEKTCYKNNIVPSADTKNLNNRFSLYHSEFNDQGILLCGAKTDVQEAFNALTEVPEKDRLESKVYKAATSVVGSLLKNKLYSSVLADMKAAATSAGATVTPYKGLQVANDMALFTMEGKKAVVQMAFQCANRIEAAWVAGLKERPLSMQSRGDLTPGKIKYLEENFPSLKSLSFRHGVFVKHAPPARTDLRTVVKAFMGQVELVVVQGNILKVGCDAIVNPANSHLYHSAGLAAAIADAAGRDEIEREGEEVKATLPNRKVATGTAVCTGAYKLSELNPYAKVVIHAVGPRYETGSASERADYRRCVMSALDQTVNNKKAEIKYVSIALMGSGLYGWPVQEAAELLVASISEWIDKASASGQLQLSRIILADMNENSVEVMAQTVQSFNDRLPALLTAMQLEPVQQRAPLPVPAAVKVNQKPRPQFQWFWECYVGDATYQQGIVKEGKRRWMPYDYDQVLQIEEACKHNTLPVQLNGGLARAANGAVYEIAREDCTTFDGQESYSYTQTRVTKGIKVNFKRAVRWEKFEEGMTMVGYNDVDATLVTAPPPAPAADPQPLTPRGFQKVSQIDLVGSNVDSGFLVRGPPAQLEKMEQALYTMLEQAKKTSTNPIDLSITAPEDWEVVLNKLHVELTDAGVEAEIIPAVADSADHGGSSAYARQVLVRTLGDSELARSEVVVTNFVNKVMRKLAEEAVVQWPANWTNGPFSVQDTNVELVDVERDTAEWDEVEDQWRHQSLAPGTVRNATHSVLGKEYNLVSVRRVQNPIAWAAYYYRTRLTAAKISPVDAPGSIFQRANEWIMKHGTFHTDPATVVRGADGIDCRYCGGGNLYYGQAAYTAENASYSDGYAYKVPETTNRQMLLVRVAAGRIYEEAADGRVPGDHRNFRTPPNGYHSVRGNVSTSPSVKNMAIMVYHTDTAYPSYLLTYCKEKTSK